MIQKRGLLRTVRQAPTVRNILRELCSRSQLEVSPAVLINWVAFAHFERHSAKAEVSGQTYTPQAKAILAAFQHDSQNKIRMFSAKAQSGQEYRSSQKGKHVAHSGPPKKSQKKIIYTPLGEALPRHGGGRITWNSNECRNVLSSREDTREPIQ